MPATTGIVQWMLIIDSEVLLHTHKTTTGTLPWALTTIRGNIPG